MWVSLSVPDKISTAKRVCNGPGPPDLVNVFAPSSYQAQAIGTSVVVAGGPHV